MICGYFTNFSHFLHPSEPVSICWIFISLRPRFPSLLFLSFSSSSSSFPSPTQLLRRSLRANSSFFTYFHSSSPKNRIIPLIFFRDGLHLIHHHQMAFRLERKKRLTQSISNTHTHLCIHLSINTLTTSNWRERKTYWKYADNRSVVWVKRLPQWCHWCVLSTAHMGKR